MIDGQNFFDYPVKNDLITYDNIKKRATGQGDDYTTGCYKKHCKMIVIGLSKQQALDVDPKAMQQINFTGNLEQQAKIYLIIEGAKETALDFSQVTVTVF